MLLLGDRDGSKGRGHILQAFVFGDLGKVRIHGDVFVMFARCGGFQVVQRRSDDSGREAASDFDLAALQELEEAFGVFLLLFGGFDENVGDLDKTVLASLTGKIRVAVARL